MNNRLLRDVIEIPERIGDDDYVLKLTEGVGDQRIAQTLAQYVVTKQIAEAFDKALGLVSSALAEDESKAAFLTGSFGSGKSHFMAVLHALLGHDPHARQIPELAHVIQRHDKVLENKKVLRLAYHFLDAENVESVVLGGYVSQIQALVPGCDLPAVHRSDEVLKDGERMRERLGDNVFFAGMNARAATASGDVWSGVLEGEEPWTAESYDRARAAAPGSDQRQQLVSALVRTFFTAYTKASEFVSLEEGLAAITAHAKKYGFDAVVMFLDELVLWLTFLVRDREAFARESQKLTKFVEHGTGQRAVPLIAFVARQMDLRKYFVQSGGALGAEQEALDTAFRHQEGRFLTIRLGDENLPYVAEKRLLRPKDDKAKATVDEAFQNLDRRPDVWDTLLDGVNTEEGHRGSDQASFRRTYPFSPALVSALRTLASAMQRDRTALKVMQQVLVARRDELTIDDVVPVGDIFDHVVNGSQALDIRLEGAFKSARTLYDDKLRPLLLGEHNLDEESAHDVPYGHPFLADDRLAKTLLLSAMAPEVPALKELTAGRLAALNHGSIVSPLKGDEASVVLAKLRRWEPDVPEIHITDQTRNPVIRMRIAEVDYESVVLRAKGEDNSGRRIYLLKQLVWEAFGVADVDGDAFGISRQRVVWRGTPREIELRFGNVRDRLLPDTDFDGPEADWRFVVDYPFDEEGKSARQDLERLDGLRAQGVSRNTVVWVPYFLAPQRQRDLGRLVILDWLLSGSGDRWTRYADHLPEMDRIQARSILESQRDALRRQLRQAIQQAYGAAAVKLDTIEREEGHDHVLVSLTPGFAPAAPVGADLRAAFENLVDQAYTALFPGHPRFEPGGTAIRSAEISAVREAVEAASQEQDGRVLIEPSRRTLISRVANPLGIGHMGETHFVVRGDTFRWAMVFEAAMGRAGKTQSDSVTIAEIRAWIRDDDVGAGLRQDLSDLIVVAWATYCSRAWYRHGGAVVPSPAPGALTPDMELRTERLPGAEDWRAAVERAGILFGVRANPYLTGAAVTEFATKVKEHVTALGSEPARLVKQLREAYQRLGIGTASQTGRLATAVATSELVDRIRRGDRMAVVESVARADLPVDDSHAGASLHSARDVSMALETHRWDHVRSLLEGESGSDERSRKAHAILDRLRAALLAEQLAASLEPELRRTEDDLIKWAVEGSTQTTPPPPPPPPVKGQSSRITSPEDLDRTVERLRRFVDEHDGVVVVEWRYQP